RPEGKQELQEKEETPNEPSRITSQENIPEAVLLPATGVEKITSDPPKRRPGRPLGSKNWPALKSAPEI
ncbi:hypothetical protein KQX54_002217, partial [Cotesia glomerata]